MPVSAPGGPAGVTYDVKVACEAPIALCAEIWNRYETPFCKPETLHGLL